MLSWLQQNPIVVELGEPPPAARDISIDFVLGMFAMAGVLLAAAAVGSLAVACVILAYKRWRHGGVPPAGPSHTQLGI